MVFKNLSKDPIFYTKDGQFGVKGLGYTTEAPGLGTPKEAKGKYKASGYGDLKESKLTLSGTDKAIRMLKSELKTNKVEFETEGNKVIVDDSSKTKMAIKIVKERTGMQSLKLNETIDGNLKERMFSSKPLGDVEGAKEMALKVFKAWIKKNSGLSDPESLTDEQVIEKIKDFAKKNPSNIVHQLWKQEKHLFEGESLEENKLRKVIREIISEELNEMIPINPIKGGGGKRFPRPDINLSNDIVKKFDLSNPGPNAPAYDESIKIPHIKISTSKVTGLPALFISNFLDIALKGITKGRTTRETEAAKNTLQTMQGDIIDKDWSGVRALIKKYAEVKPIPYSIGGGKAVSYHEVKFPSNPKMLGDKFETGFSLSKTDNGLKITLPTPKDKSKEDTMESLRESVEKDLVAINKEAEHEILQFKLDKIDELTNKRKMQLGKLDEDEDMKALTDKNKVKELERDVKKLEAARKKVEKMMLRFKGKKKEVIDEVEDDIDVDPEYFDQSVEDLDLGKTVDSIDTDNSNLALSQQQNIKDYLNSIAPSDQKSRRTYG
jgi:hypothetical protein